MSLDNIVNRILEDANAKAAELVKDAEAKAKDLLARAEEEGRALSDQIVGNARLKSQEETRRSLVTRNLEVKKEIAKEKLSLIDSAFRASYEKLISLDDAGYRELVEKGVIGTREKEGRLLFSKRDSGRINARFVDGLNRTHGLKSEFGGYFDSADGGFLLEKDRVRMDMRFSTLLKDLRARYLFEVSTLLFS
jgi:vacuolar-type H+-ATPase subunit E/Vma4